MADKELKQMNRSELIEIIYQYRIQVDELMAQVRNLTDALNERCLRMEKSGSIAEAAISVNKVFEAAQQAAEQYLYSIKTVNEESENSSRRAAEEIIENAKKEAEEIKREAERKYNETIIKGSAEYSEFIAKGQKECEQMLAQTEKKCAEMRSTVLQLMLASGENCPTVPGAAGESE